MKNINILAIVATLIAAIGPEFQIHANERAPNIILIYTDDFGFGDVGCYGARTVKTPHIDSLAREGILFTDAHAGSATCTPSRYSLLTGEYAWRKKGTGIARGNAGAIIRPDRVTLPSLLKQANYHTAVVGKWHLGLGDGNVDWNKAIQPGPLEIGFDYCFLIPATGDRVPCVYVEDHHVVGLDPNDPIRVSYGKKIGDDPTGKENPELLKMHPSHGHDMTIVNGISRIGYMTGGHAARWIDEDMADVITERAVNYINQQKGSEKPFFLLFSTHDIHVPRVPHARFVGSTPMGPRGDCIAQTDWCVGEILKALEVNELTKNTLVIFTSDNGPVVDDGYQDDAVEKLGDHKPGGYWRGGKYSAFEAGTRVPLLIKWPGKIAAGSQSKALVSQIDFAASFAAIQANQSQIAIPDNAIPDSLNQLEALLGKDPVGRDHLVQQARPLSLRMGKWKYIEPSKGARINKNVNIELGHDPNGMLFDLSADPGEQNDLRETHPEQFEQMKSRLAEVRAAGRTR